jgi:hypothetical protein
MRSPTAPTRGTAPYPGNYKPTYLNSTARLASASTALDVLDGPEAPPTQQRVAHSYVISLMPLIQAMHCLCYMSSWLHVHYRLNHNVLSLKMPHVRPATHIPNEVPRIQSTLDIWLSFHSRGSHQVKLIPPPPSHRRTSTLAPYLRGVAFSSATTPDGVVPARATNLPPLSPTRTVAGASVPPSIIVTSVTEYVPRGWQRQPSHHIASTVSTAPGSAPL